MKEGKEGGKGSRYGFDTIRQLGRICKETTVDETSIIFLSLHIKLISLWDT